MNQMFFGNARVMLFTPDGGSTPPATSAETRIWWSQSESDYDDYLIEGTLDCPALVEKGLMPEGSGSQFEPSWNNQPVKIEIGSAVTSIGSDAFYGCSGLTIVTISDSVTSIGDSAFYNCSGLTSVTIPDSVKSIYKTAFSHCGLTSVTIIASGKPGASATDVKQMLIDADIPENVIWNMPS